jgi:hypothetical protein
MIAYGTFQLCMSRIADFDKKCRDREGLIVNPMGNSPHPRRSMGAWGCFHGDDSVFPILTRQWRDSQVGSRVEPLLCAQRSELPCQLANSKLH